MTIKNNLLMFVATAALVSSAAVASPQGAEGVIQGSVTDDETGAGLPDVSISLYDASRGRTFTTKTDKNGRFYKRNITGSTYQVTVEKEGYKPLQEELRVAAGGEHRFAFKLAKAAPEGAKEFAEGFAAFNSGDNEAAAKAFEAAMEKAPDLPEIKVNLALAYLRLKRQEEAVTLLEQAATMAPDDPRTLFRLGGAYVEMTDYDKAITALEKGLAIESDMTDEVARETMITLGAVYFAKGESDKSVEAFEKVLAAAPGAPIPTLGLAKAYLSKGELDRARELFDQVATSAPGTPEAAQAEIFLTELKKGEAAEASEAPPPNN